MKLLVSKLDRRTKEQELKKIFEEFGDVDACSVVMDPKTAASKGFGFIEMPNSAEANLAIRNINNKTIGNNKIRVKAAQ